MSEHRPFPTQRPLIISHLNSPPPPSHRCTPPGHASASARACPRHAAGSSGALCHSGVNTHHIVPLWPGHKWGSSHSLAHAPSPRSRPADGNWPDAPRSTQGSEWPPLSGTMSLVTGRRPPTGPSRTAQLPCHLHGPWQPQHLLCPWIMVT